MGTKSNHESSALPVNPFAGEIPEPVRARRTKRLPQRIKKNKTVYCLIENIIFIAAIFLIWFTYNPLREEFITMNLQPLLILVALMSLKYGNYLSVLSAAMSSAAFAYAYYLLGRDIAIFIVEWSHYKFILMFFLTAVILGTFKDKSEQTIESLRDDLSVAAADLTALVETEKKSQLINEELKKQIIGAEDSILSLYEVASALETVNSEEIYTEVMTVMARFLRAKTVSIYSVDRNNKYLRLKIRMGHADRAGLSLKIEDHRYLQRVVGEQEIVKLSVESEKGDPIFAAPLIIDGRTIAVISLDEADISMVTEYSYNLFKIIMEWISKALIRAIEIEGIANRDFYYPDTRIMKMEHFNKRLTEEKKRLSKFGLNYGLIAFQDIQFPVEDLSSILNTLIRQVDVAGYDPANKEMYVLLPITPEEMVLKVKERIVSGLNSVSEVGNRPW